MGRRLQLGNPGGIGRIENCLSHISGVCRMALRRCFAAIAFAGLVAGGARAGDISLLRGTPRDDATTVNLKGSPAAVADTVEVFHRLGKCCGLFFHRDSYASSYSSGCYG